MGLSRSRLPGSLGIIYGIARFAQSRANRATDTVADLVYTRDALQQTPTIDVDSVFTEKTIRRLNNGDGLTAKFSVFFRGNAEWEKMWTIEKLHVTGNTDWPTRRKYVRDKIKEFKQDVADFSADRPRNWTDEILLDDTDGVNNALKLQVLREVGNLNIPDRLDKGDGVDFWTFRLTSTDFLQDDSIVVPQGEGVTGYDKIQKKLASLVEIRGTARTTAFATGLFNALSKNQGKPNRTVLIYSDGLENSDLGDFYRKPPHKGVYKEFAEKLQSRKPCPDLSGVWIYWYGPKTGRNSNQIRASLKFWEWLLTQHHAHVEIEY